MPIWVRGLDLGITGFVTDIYTYWENLPTSHRRLTIDLLPHQTATTILCHTGYHQPTGIKTITTALSAQSGLESA
jgi:hypothetical protein